MSSVRERLGQTVRWIVDGFVHRLYSDRVRSIVEGLGLDTVLYQWYYSFYWRLASTVEEDVDGITSAFHVTGPTEASTLVNIFAKERPVLEKVLGTVSEDDVFFDVGANVGVYTCFAAGKAREVVAVEPSAANASRIRDNLALNGRSAQVFEYALTNVDGSAEFSVTGGNPGEQTGSLLASGGGDDVTVDARKGDSLITAEQLPTPTVLKIDVEGSEMDVIEGFRRTLRSGDCRLVYCEVHPHLLKSQGHSHEDVVNCLQEYGFQVGTIHREGGQLFIRGIS